MSKRRKFTPEFKAQVVLEILTGTKSAAEVCSQYGIKQSVVSRWKQTFVQGAASVFQEDAAHQEDRARMAELERLVGRLTMEVEILKKASIYVSSLPTRKELS